MQKLLNQSSQNSSGNNVKYTKITNENSSSIGWYKYFSNKVDAIKFSYKWENFVASTFCYDRTWIIKKLRENQSTPKKTSCCITQVYISPPTFQHRVFPHWLAGIDCQKICIMFWHVKFFGNNLSHRSSKVYVKCAARMSLCLIFNKAVPSLNVL